MYAILVIVAIGLAAALAWMTLRSGIRRLRSHVRHEPAWWPEFEEEFWAHVDRRERTARPTRPTRPTRREQA